MPKNEPNSQEKFLTKETTRIPQTSKPPPNTNISHCFYVFIIFLPVLISVLFYLCYSPEDLPALQTQLKSPIPTPTNSGITHAFVVSLMNNMTPSSSKSHKIPHLDAENLFLMMENATEMMKKYQNIEYINVAKNSRLSVIGDIHGQFYDLKNIFEINGYPSEENWYLFNLSEIL